MQQAATDSVPISPMLASDVPHPVSSSPSSSSPFDQYKAIRRNALVLTRQPHGRTMRTHDIHDHAEFGLMHSGEHDDAFTCVLFHKERTSSRAMAESGEYRRCQHIFRGIDPFPWIAEMIDIKKESDFFQTRGADTGWSIRAWVMALAPA